MVHSAIANFGEDITWDDVIETEHPDSITLDDTVLNFERFYSEPRISTKGEGKLLIQGGVHVDPLILSNTQHIEITGNVFSHNLIIPRTSQNDSKSMSLRGFWGCANVGFRGNLGLDFDVPVMDAEKLEHHLERDSEKAWSANKPAPDTPLPSVIFKAQLVSYSLPDYLGFKTEKAGTLYATSSFEVPWNVLSKATEIRQFCAYKDIHTRPNCRCALYHGLLLTGDPLATAYYLRATPTLAQYEPLPLQTVPVRTLEDLLEEKLRHLAQTYTTRDEIAEYAAVNALTKESFTKHMRQFGFSNIEALWLPGADPTGVWTEQC